MRKAILPLVFVPTLLLFAIACGGEDLQTVQGNIGMVEYGTKDKEPVTIFIVEDKEGERYFLGIYQHDPVLKRGQQVEVIFNNNNTLVKLDDLTLYIKDEDGEIRHTEVIKDVSFKKVISYKILKDNK